VLHYVKKNQENPSGALLWLESPIHVSNVMKAEKYDARNVSKR
jgi:ribosomal protein L24